MAEVQQRNDSLLPASRLVSGTVPHRQGPEFGEAMGWGKAAPAIAGVAIRLVTRLV
jgi:hypothetical protein